MRFMVNNVTSIMTNVPLYMLPSWLRLFHAVKHGCLLYGSGIQYYAVLDTWNSYCLRYCQTLLYFVTKAALIQPVPVRLHGRAHLFLTALAPKYCAV